MSPATLYADRAATPMSNPIVADAYGNIEFFAEEGVYYLRVNGADIRIILDEPATGGGGGGAEKYLHIQAAPAALWTINHGLATKPTVVLQIDSAPEESVLTDIRYPDINTVEIEWPSPESGKAYLL